MDWDSGDVGYFIVYTRPDRDGRLDRAGLFPSAALDMDTCLRCYGVVCGRENTIALYHLPI